MTTLIEWISQPWPWYVAGPVIGLMVPLHLILLNRTFGISSSFRHLCAATVMVLGVLAGVLGVYIYASLRDKLPH